MFWRPENWINPYRIGSVTGTTQRELGFEEGADAMLKVLMEKATALTHDGYLVFIPEEK